MLCNFSGFSFHLLITFSKNHFRNTIRVSNGLDPDQDRQNVGPDLGPNCLQRTSADDRSPANTERLKMHKPLATVFYPNISETQITLKELSKFCCR